MDDVNRWLVNVQVTTEEHLEQVSNFRGLLIIVGAILIAYVLIKLVGRFTIGAVRVIANQADTAANEDRFVQWRQIETYLSVVLALVRAFIIGIVAYFALRMMFPGQDLLPATIGIGTFVIIIAGATIGPLLRDLMNGAIMIVSGWFSVGDYIKVEPFADVSGVVEQVTLRSTKIRNINGDVIWLHNQYIQGIRVTPHGVRTLALDVFVRDLEKAVELIEEVMGTLPSSPTMIAGTLKITDKEKLSDKLWRITVIGHTPPGREWLIEDFIREALQNADKHKKKPVIVYGPLVRYADETAEKRFGRAVRVKGGPLGGS